MGERARVMVVSAHADDEVLGAGGALWRHVSCGGEARVLVVADCRTVRDPAREPELPLAALEAGRVLGASVIFGHRRGMSLASEPELALNEIVESAVAEYKPDVVYTHLQFDLNSDHRAVSRAVMVATRPHGAWTPRRVLHFEVPSSTGWETPATFSPNVFVALDEGDLERKLEAMACYRDELRPAPHPRGLEALRTRAAYWGQQCGRRYAEPFMMMREVT